MPSATLIAVLEHEHDSVAAAGHAVFFRPGQNLSTHENRRRKLSDTAIL